MIKVISKQGLAIEKEFIETHGIEILAHNSCSLLFAMEKGN